MGVDAILHSVGNSTRVDYISRAFRASRHSTSYLDELHCDCGIMYRSSTSNVGEVLQHETILLLSRNGQGQQQYPFSALRQAESIIDHSGALPPPNTRHSVWCGLREGTGGITINSTSGSSSQLWIYFVGRSHGTDHRYWKIWSCPRVGSLKPSQPL